MIMRSILVLLVGLLLLPGSLLAQAEGEIVRIEQGRLRLGFDGNGELREMVDRINGAAFTAGGGEIWELRLLPGAGRERLRPGDAGELRVHRLLDEPAGLMLTWSSFGLPDARRLRVRATVRVRADGLSEWHLEMENLESLPVEEVRFPRIQEIPRLGTREQLAVPRWMGQLARDPRALLAGADGTGARLEYFYPGQMSLQALALYEPQGPGLYLATDDTAAYRKSFALQGAANGSATFEIVTPLEDPGSGRPGYALPFRAVVGTFQGDWITAAEIYRDWGTRQRWARESRLTRGLVPEWVTDTGIWVWNRGSSPGVLPPAVALQRAAGIPVSVFWHWWHSGPYDTAFPDYLPPREGAEPFRRAVHDARAAGVRSIVYMNQRLWCQGADSWATANPHPHAVMERDGSRRLETYNIFDPQPCLTMDVTTSFWRDTYAGLAGEVLLDYGVDGVYMDQSALSLVCWDPAHGHPVNGGNYWMHGFRQLTDEIRARTARRQGQILAAEGAGESWLPEMDLFLTLQVSWERYAQPGHGWEVIPFFQAVYHAHGITYGTYSSLTFPPYDELWPAEFAPAEPLHLLDRRYRHQFALEHARSFVWGMQPSIANFLPAHLSERPEEMEYLIGLAQLRREALDYLLYGTFRRPPALEVPQMEVDISRISIYAARRGGATAWRGHFPSVLAGAWSGSRGGLAIPLVNISEEPVSFEVALDAADYGLPASGELFLLGDGPRTRFGSYSDGAIRVRVDLPARGARILELPPASAGAGGS
jgi:hypothetical protein